MYCTTDSEECDFVSQAQPHMHSVKKADTNIKDNPLVWVS